MTNEELSKELFRLRAGEMQALETIYLELRKPVMTVICRIVRDAVLAEELMQDVFVKLWRSPPKEDVKNPRAWLFRVAHNLAIDSLRRRTAAELPETLAAPRFEEGVHARLDVERALAQLDTPDREIVTLHLNAQLRFREMAEVSGLPLGTVLWRYSRAIGRLRALLNEGGI